MIVLGRLGMSSVRITCNVSLCAVTDLSTTACFFEVKFSRWVPLCTHACESVCLCGCMCVGMGSWDDFLSLLQTQLTSKHSTLTVRWLLCSYVIDNPLDIFACSFVWCLCVFSFSLPELWSTYWSWPRRGLLNGCHFLCGLPWALEQEWSRSHLVLAGEGSHRHD